MPTVLGVDSSTQSTKVEIRDLESGEVVATGSAPHPPTEPPVSEQDPESWWQALAAAVSQLGSARADVAALAVAGQQHGLVLLDGDGISLRPAKLWNDTTSADNAAALVENFGAAAWARACGSVPVASFTISKLAWVAENEPDLLEQVSYVMLPHDYLTWRLTAEHVTDRGDASGTGWFDPSANQYREDLLANVVARDWITKLPTVLDPHAVAGELAGDAADALGLRAGIPVAAGTGDNMAAALGLGLAVGDVAISLGTSGTVYAVTSSGTHDESGYVAGFADATGRFLPLVCTLNATKVTDTVAGWLGTDAPGLAELALGAERIGTGPVLVPYFDGERTPNLPNAAGLFSGLRTSTTREQLALAAHDGVLCGLLDGLDVLRSTGVDAAGRIHLIGGGARSAAYRQRSADLSGEPVTIPTTDETVATGAALQASMIITEGTPEEIATAWGLGSGETVEPALDATDVRRLYRSTQTAAAEL
jgi:xylulokinase